MELLLLISLTVTWKLLIKYFLITYFANREIGVIITNIITNEEICEEKSVRLWKGNKKMREKLQLEQIHTDVLVIGGGTAGCYAALTISRNSDLSVLIAEKANIKRSGCLAAGINAINAYIVKGRKPQDYVDYATKDAGGIVRKDLLLTAAEHFNEVTEDAY